MRLNHAHHLLGIRHHLGHRQRDSKRSVPSGDRCNSGYPFYNRLFRLHPLVIHPLILNIWCGYEQVTLRRLDLASARIVVALEIIGCLNETSVNQFYYFILLYSTFLYFVMKMVCG